MYRPIFKIAAEIEKAWEYVSFSARPYLDAMKAINRIDEMYGADTAKSVVMYFLSNASKFQGDDARRIKAELRRMLKVSAVKQRKGIYERREQ